MSGDGKDNVREFPPFKLPKTEDDPIPAPAAGEPTAVETTTGVDPSTFIPIGPNTQLEMTTMTQILPLQSVEAGAKLREMIAKLEQDGLDFDQNMGRWVLVRQRAFVANVVERKTDETSGIPEKSILGPDGQPISH